MPKLIPPVQDERQGLMVALGQQRLVVKLATFGLTDEQARMVPSSSALSLGGLIKHLAGAERSWTGYIQQRSSPRSAKDYQTGFQLLSDETLAGALADYDRAAAATDAVVGAIDDLSQPVPVPEGVPWFPADLEAWSVRWVLLHLITETARHAGHADIIRESIDGATAYPLMATAEQWPATPWIPPWTPPETPAG